MGNKVALDKKLDYDEYGDVIQNTNPDFQPFGFCGGLYDNSTKLTRFGYRDFDAQVGRWTNKDPIGFGGRVSNLYEYCLNDPMNNFDPSGLQVIQIPGPHNDIQIQQLFLNMWNMSGRGRNSVEVYSSILEGSNAVGLGIAEVRFSTGKANVILANDAEYFAHTHPIYSFQNGGYSPEGGPQDYIRNIKGNYVVTDKGVWLVTDPKNNRGNQVLGKDWINELIKALKGLEKENCK